MQDPAGHAANMRDLFAMYSEGKIKPQISASFPLEQAADALRMMEERKVMGKVVLTMD